MRAKQDGVNDVMRYLGVSGDLAERIRQYYEYVWLRYRDTDLFKVNPNLLFLRGAQPHTHTQSVVQRARCPQHAQ